MKLLPWLLFVVSAVIAVAVSVYAVALQPHGMSAAGFTLVEGSEFFDVYPESSIATACETWTSDPSRAAEIAAEADLPDASWDGVVLLRRCEIEAVEIPPAMGSGVRGGGVPQMP